MLKFENAERTAATFNGAAFTMAAPEDWDSIGDGPTREAVLAWLAAGNLPIPASPMIEAIPKVVTMRQARLALLQRGLLDQVNAAIAAKTGAEGDAARIEWDYSSTVERHRPLALAMITELGLSEAQADQLFSLAASL